MLIQHHWSFIQSTPSNTWEVDNVPEGAMGMHIDHVEQTDGQLVNPDRQLLAPYGIQLDFGIHAVAGVAYGSYYTESPQPTEVVQGEGGVINIYQYNGGEPQSQ